MVAILIMKVMSNNLPGNLRPITSLSLKFFICKRPANSNTRVISLKL